MTVSTRARRDRCPGVTRPWLAEDGALVRLRLVGGRIAAAQLAALSALSAAYGDGDVHLTGRANLQVRGLPHDGDRLAPDVHAAVLATGLVPSEAHDLVRNIMVSPLSGRRGGRTDLRPVADELDLLIRADGRLAELPGRFLFVLDDGRGDLHDRQADLGLVALDDQRVQLRVGEEHGDIATLADAPQALVALAHRFLDVRGTGPGAAWHVRELSEPLGEVRSPEPGALVTSPPLRHDDEHVAAPDGVVDQALAARLAAYGGELVVTPWRGVLVPEESAS
jgi:precorrin-3B synthase